MLEAKKIAFAYPGGKRRIVEGFSFSLKEGERRGIMAPSGQGKTTLCRLLAGYMRPDSGEVLLDGRSLHSFGGYCPVQLIGQHPEMVINPRIRLEETMRDAGSLDSSLLADLGIEEEWLRRFPMELSGGELQRFCIARALGPATRFLLADEITTMLDLATQAQIWHFLLHHIRRRNIGLLVVSHDAVLLERLCPEIVEMK